MSGHFLVNISPQRYFARHFSWEKMLVEMSVDLFCWIFIFRDFLGNVFADNPWWRYYVSRDFLGGNFFSENFW